MWKAKLAEIIQEKQMYDEKINGGASEDEIYFFKKKVSEELNITLPEEYINTLRTINGIEFNGFILYGVDEADLSQVPNQHVYGLNEYNKIWYENEWQHQYIFLGESNISWYVYDKEKNKYYELDNPSGRIIKKYNYFEELLEKLLSDSLL